MAFSMAGLIQAIIGNKVDSVVGVDIGTSSVKIVQLRANKGVAVLETYGEIALGPYAGEAVGKTVKLSHDKSVEAIKDLIREATVTSRSVGISIPFASSLVTTITLPQTDAESLKHIMPIEARKYIPVPVSDVTLDWYVIPKDETEQSAFAELRPQAISQQNNQQVLLVAIQNAILQQYQSISTDLSFNVRFYEIEIFSAIRSSLGHGLIPILIVDIGASSTKMYVVERGIVHLTHMLQVGSQQMTETLGRSLGWEFEKAERIKREHGMIASTAFSIDENDKIKTAILPTLDRIFGEINRVILSYGERSNKNIAKVILAGGGASLPGIKEEGARALHVDVEVAHPFTHTEAPAFLDATLRQIGPGFAVAVGLALRELKNN